MPVKVEGIKNQKKGIRNEMDRNTCVNLHIGHEALNYATLAKGLV